ncbi:hypothetical protein HB904_09580 [Listeria booriae]|uniref:Uncharacterized protein n=1 Tax=Listeria booriae TaxID=1552123 RepID=A0A842AKE0_9LIST|nr:hypothetical protein [Listeria booriae]MBC1616438.1 hypothetical protein [Listeria booriae]
MATEMGDLRKDLKNINDDIMQYRVLMINKPERAKDLSKVLEHSLQRREYIENETAKLLAEIGWERSFNL